MPNDSLIMPLSEEELNGLSAEVHMRLKFRDQILYDRLSFEVKQLRRRFASQCDICHRTMDNLSDPSTQNCGGTCRRCMSDAGDPDCQAKQ